MSRETLIYGWHAVSGALDRDPAGILEMWVQSERRDRRAQELAGKAKAAGIAVHGVARHHLDRRHALRRPL